MYNLLVLASILGCAWLGFQRGFGAAVTAALEWLACLMVAIVLHETVSDHLHAGLRFVVGDVVPQRWIIPLVFASLSWGGMALLRWLCHLDDEEGDGDEDGDEGLADRLGGAVAGGIGGIALAGGALVTISMIPLLSGWKPLGSGMLFDPGSLVLRAAAPLVGDVHEGRSLVIHGEPASRASRRSAGLASEPWLDMDADTRPTESDRYSDVDESGTFTKDLYYTDVDGDGVRRVGLIDKYAAGCWDSNLNRDDRPRPVEKKPEQPKPAAAKPEAPAETPPQKPESTTTPEKPPAPEPAVDEEPAPKQPTDAGAAADQAADSSPSVSMSASISFSRRVMVLACTPSNFAARALWPRVT
jgi:hypothetical protein